MNLAEQLDRLSQPALQASIIAAFGLLSLCWRHYRLSAGLLTLATLWLGLCATPTFATWLQHRLENQYPAKPVTSCPKVDAIVILGGGVLPQSSSDWSDEVADTRTTRLGVGLQLYRNSCAPVILLSGGDHEAMRMARVLEQQGIPVSALVIEDASTTTHQNALYSTILLKREQRQRILLVTSAIHMPRAAASFRREGLTVIPSPAGDSARWSLDATNFWWPQRAALRLSTRCLREYLGRWGYELLGWA